MFSSFPVISRGGPQYGDARNEAICLFFFFFFFFFLVSTLTFPLLTKAGSCMLRHSKQLHSRSCARPLGRVGRTIFEPFRKDYYAVRVRPAFDLHERFQFWVYLPDCGSKASAKNKKKEGSYPCSRVSTRTKRVRTRQYLWSRSEAGEVRVIPVRPLYFPLSIFFPRLKMDLFVWASHPKRNLCSLIPRFQS
ncbi:hypothetical protein F5888DRAFT_603448 [Russula emetica]|nr:hypothetical protein F5888DRAFT_603448 [Russula emetica]